MRYIYRERERSNPTRHGDFCQNRLLSYACLRYRWDTKQNWTEGMELPILEMTRAWGEMPCLSNRKWLVTKNRQLASIGIYNRILSFPPANVLDQILLLLLMPQLHFDAASLGSSARFRRSRLGLTNGWNDWHGETDVLWLLIQ